MTAEGSNGELKEGKRGRMSREPPFLVEVSSPADILRLSRGKEVEEGKENRRGDCQSHPRKHLTGLQVVILSDTSVQEASSFKTCAAPLQRAAHALSSSSLSDWSVQSIWRSDRKRQIRSVM